MSRSGALLGLLPAVILPAVLLLSDKASVWPAVISYHALCIGVPLLARQTPAGVGLASRPSGRSMAWSLLLSAVLIAAGAGISRPAFLSLVPKAWMSWLGLLHPWWAFVAYSMCVNPLVEEVFWRGFLLPHTGRVGGAFLFYLMHVTALSVLIGPWHALWIALPTLPAGVLWGWMREHVGSLWPCVITHLGADVAILVAAAALRR